MLAEILASTYYVLDTVVFLWKQYNKAITSMGSGANPPGSESATSSCVTLGKLLNLSVPQFPHL